MNKQDNSKSYKKCNQKYNNELNPAKIEIKTVESSET